MKQMFWYVLIERYNSGTVKAAVLKNKLATSRPPEFYKMEPGRELLGEWVNSAAEANAIVTEARALNASLAGRVA